MSHSEKRGDIKRTAGVDSLPAKADTKVSDTGTASRPKQTKTSKDNSGTAGRPTGPKTSKTAGGPRTRNLTRGEQDASGDGPDKDAGDEGDDSRGGSDPHADEGDEGDSEDNDDSLGARLARLAEVLTNKEKTLFESVQAEVDAQLKDKDKQLKELGLEVLRLRNLVVDVTNDSDSGDPSGDDEESARRKRARKAREESARRKEAKKTAASPRPAFTYADEEKDPAATSP